MLIQFNVTNVFSFKEQSELSMVASAIKEKRDVNTFNAGGLCLLKSAAIYGKNASGKSNFLSALYFMKHFVKSSVNEMDDGQEAREFSNCFKLDEESESLPLSFEISILLDGNKYRYGFQLGRQSIINEWLFCAPKKKEHRLFVRTNTNEFDISDKFSEGNGLEKKTRIDALFLTVCSQFNGEISKSISKWFGSMNLYLHSNASRFPTLRGMEKDPTLTQRVSALLTNLDTDIEKIELEKVATDSVQVGFPSDIPDDIKHRIMEVHSTKIITFHRKFNKDNSDSLVKFDLYEDESGGTIKIFHLAGPILEALAEGRILVVDELEAKLHPKITRYLIGLFNSNETNPNNAQLIFSTHDVTLLDKEIMRRDQMWFVEKDRYGASKLFSLDEFKIDDDKIRNDASYSKAYMAGRYTAIPRISKDTSELLKRKPNE